MENQQMRNNYFFVGSLINGQDYTNQFLVENKWMFGSVNDENDRQYQKMLATYNKIKPGDYLVIKSTYTKKNNLPFDKSADEYVSVMGLKAFGTVRKNIGDGHTLLVDWDTTFKAKEWYFYTGRETIWQVPVATSKYAQRLISFVTGSQPQDYTWFINQPDWQKYQLVPKQVEEEPQEVDDYYKFKKILALFAHLLRANNKNNAEEFTAGEARTGQGYKENSKIRKSYVKYREFSNGRTIDVNVQSGFQLFNRPNYVHWTETGINIRPIWHANKGDIASFQIFNNDTEIYLGKKYDIEKLEINNESAPNQLIQNFFKAYVEQLEISEVSKMGNNDQSIKEYARTLLAAKNIIFRGAPGTGKTYLANEIAASLVSNGRTTKTCELSDEERAQIGFVQFHPSYDYTDFVEGLRPTTSEDGVVSFALKSGSFKAFVERAIIAQEEGGQDNFEQSWNLFFDKVAETGVDGFNDIKTLNGSPIKQLLTYERNGMQGIYPAGTTIYLNHDQIYNVYRGLPGVPKGGLDNYRKAIVKYLISNFGLKDYQPMTASKKNAPKYIFIIDEINRGEISKIFGELFFSIDPGYRGNKDGILTQYANLHADSKETFYIPDNVYIIGTMNDIDRSVDMFDFAMRRRFTFIEITAEASARKILKYEATIDLMKRFNKQIISKDGGNLTADYQVGASYFQSVDEKILDGKALKILWDTKLLPLLKDYFRGEHDVDAKISMIDQVYSGSEQNDE